jgi:hypothetical protein
MKLGEWPYSTNVASHAWDHPIGPHSHHRLGRRFWEHYGLDRTTLIHDLNQRYAMLHPAPHDGA